MPRLQVVVLPDGTPDELCSRIYEVFQSERYCIVPMKLLRVHKRLLVRLNEKRSDR